MSRNRTEAEAWERVAMRLRYLVTALEDGGCRGLVAPLYVRLGVLVLRAAVGRDRDALAERVFAPGPLPPEAHRLLGAYLEQQVAGGVPPRAVLEELPREVRAEAEVEILEALRHDPDCRSALRAAAALALVDERWAQAATWFSRLADLPGPPEGRADALVALGEIHWRKLGEPQVALDFFGQALALTPEDLFLVDKRLKLELELERWPEAITSCERLVGRLDGGRDNPELCVTYLLTLGEIHLYGLSSPARAVRFYLDAVGRLPAYPLTFTLLIELLQSHPWSELEQGLGTLDAGGDDPAGRQRRQLASLLRAAVIHHPDAPDAAVDAFREAAAFAVASGA